MHPLYLGSCSGAVCETRLQLVQPGDSRIIRASHDTTAAPMSGRLSDGVSGARAMLDSHGLTTWSWDSPIAPAELQREQNMLAAVQGQV